MSDWAPNYIGYLDGVPQRRVYIRIVLRERGEGGGTELGISGESGDGSAGQIDMHIKAADITPGKKLTRAQIKKLWAIWDRWHLNCMKAGCEHQEAHERATPGSGWHTGEPCPVCGYRYGSEWIHERLPSDVANWLRRNFIVYTRG